MIAANYTEFRTGLKQFLDNVENNLLQLKSTAVDSPPHEDPVKTQYNRIRPWGTLDIVNQGLR